MTQANGICNRFHYGIFSKIGTVVQGKFVFKHYLYCEDASSFLGLFLHLFLRKDTSKESGNTNTYKKLGTA